MLAPEKIFLITSCRCLRVNICSQKPPYQPDFLLSVINPFINIPSCLFSF
jgi:hypothetical protein